MARRARTTSSRSRTGRPCRTSRSASPPSTTRRAPRPRSSPRARCSAPESCSRRAPFRRARSSTAPASRAATPWSTATTTRSPMSGASGSRAPIRSRITTSRAATSASRSPPRRGPRTCWSCPRAARSSRWTSPSSRTAIRRSSTTSRRRGSTRTWSASMSQTRVGYNPTLVVTYGGLAGDPYWSQAEPVWRHPLLTRHTPPNELAGRVRAVTAPAEQFADQYSAREALRLSARGVPVAIGGHGQQPGLAEHWELWSFVRGGATPVPGAALRHLRAGAALRLHRSRHDRARQARRSGRARRRSRPSTSAIRTISTW